ncbi:MAG TPA: cbb3-type cytochrome c oxidase subunit I [Gaiellaceae bacterium]|nr:cbb3-type cytochrome c oxidase subunit I [Gaiellaceae bacterium]
MSESDLQVARRLTIRYVLTAQAILAVSGLLGVIIRMSQADAGRIDKNWWYALMTAHGLGAFVGWAGFSVMGTAWWVFAQVGFPLRRVGRAMAEATYWLMVAGVAGIVVSTLVMHFAASWVFLYPLPFHSAGRWSEAASGVFLSAVLVVGLSIITWCVAVLDTAISPALHAKSSSWWNKFGIALGFGYLWPKRFATNPRSVPYSVIPLTVIAVDMIIATLPLAVLLVEMIVQSFVPSWHVDPLLAKNVLWFFGHPVVYLLLFPAVAVYYLLVPRYAGRQLVAGNVITVGWTIAIVANVIVWAHHVYIDYPVNTPQAAIDTAMQPLTFALTIVSALSLYSLFFTIFRSNYTWNAAGTALFLGLLSWLSSGLSGVVNATIAFDQVVHNSLWIVGHFHQMALLNIGFVAFAAVYAWLPDWLGRPLYSEGLAKVHIWGTFVLATLNSVFWLIQGLEGAPRRFAVLPAQYNGLTKAAIPVVIGLALFQLPFFWNIVQTLRGKVKVVKERSRRERLSVAAAEAAVMLAVAGLVGVAFGTGWITGHYTTQAKTKTVTVGSGTTTAGATTTSTSTSGAGNVAAGKQVFESASCGGCHTLAAAGSSGTVGPNLDQAKPAHALVVQRVTNGKGAMPSFKGRLTSEQIENVADFVVASTR